MKPVQAGRLKVTAAPSIKADDEGGNAYLTQLDFWCRTESVTGSTPRDSLRDVRSVRKAQKVKRRVVRRHPPHLPPERVTRADFGCPKGERNRVRPETTCGMCDPCGRFQQ